MRNLKNSELTSIEMVDQMFFEWVSEDLQLHADGFDGWKSVPVVWGTPERSWQAKFDKEMRDLDGALVLPIISVWRTSLTNSVNNKGTAVNPSPSAPGIKDASITVFSEVNQEKTNNFQKKDFFRRTQGQLIGKPAKSQKIVYNRYSIDMPVYSEFVYNVHITAQYQQQLNQILQPFVNYGFGHKYFLIKKYGHSIEVTPEDSFPIPDNDTTNSERIYETTGTFKVLANTVGMGDNSDKPKMTRNENVVEFRLGRERRITTEDLNDILKDGIKLKG